ncbi:MAG: helical backbone metal receptor [Bacteroidota bacterium]
MAGFPQRIVSLVPSQTELLWYLGLEMEVVGITKFCVHPEAWYRSKKRIGGTKQLHLDEIRDLLPDLVIANKEENTKSDIEALKKFTKVYVSDIESTSDAVEMIRVVGTLTGKEAKADQLAVEIENALSKLGANAADRSYLYFIWKDPDFVVGSRTFINSMLETAGFINHCREDRYPEWNSTFGDPNFIFLSSEPYPFTEVHFELFQQRFPFSEIMLIDGEMCSWYGPRMLDGVNYLQKLVSSIRTDQ